MISLFWKSPYKPIHRAPNSKNNSQKHKYFVRKSFSIGTCRKTHPRPKKNNECYRFSGKTPPGRYIVHRTRKTIPRGTNTSLGKIIQLVLVGMVPSCLEKNYECYSFSGKAPSGRYTLTELEKQFPEAQILR